MTKNKILIAIGAVVSIATIVAYGWVDTTLRATYHTYLGGGIEKHCLKDNPQKCFCTDAHQKVVACPI